MVQRVRPWIVLSHERVEVSNSRRVVEIILAFILAFVPAIPGLGMSVFWKWALWFVCWIGFIWVVLPDWWSLLRRLPLRSKRCAFIIAMALFVRGFYPVAHVQWYQEQALKVEGDLVVKNPVRLSVPMVQLPGSHVALPTPTPLKLFPDFELIFGLDENGSTTVTTTVEDRQGHRIVEIRKNHWQVFEDAGDKNYTNDTLEVLDEGGHVVLQLRLLPDRLAISGEWHDEFDDAVQLTDCPYAKSPYGIAPCFKVFGSSLPEKSAKVPLEPMFLYPSKDHWGELPKK